MSTGEIITGEGGPRGGVTEDTRAESTSAVPVACSLSRAGLAAQAARWVRLAALAMTRRVQTGDGLRIWFRPGPGAEEELRALAAVESDCCPWATWTVRADRGHIVLDVRSSGDGVAALHGMFTGLRPERPAEPGGECACG
jgi:hypothetical protein